MKRSSFISICAFVLAVAGVLVALYALMQKKRCSLCDESDFDDSFYLDDDFDDFDRKPNNPVANEAEADAGF